MRPRVPSAALPRGQSPQSCGGAPPVLSRQGPRSMLLVPGHLLSGDPHSDGMKITWLLALQAPCLHTAWHGQSPAGGCCCPRHHPGSGWNRGTWPAQAIWEASPELELDLRAVGRPGVLALSGLPFLSSQAPAPQPMASAPQLLTQARLLQGSGCEAHPPPPAPQLS